MRKNGFKRAAAALALFSLALILVLAGCEESDNGNVNEKKDPAVTGVTVTAAGFTGTVHAGETGTLNYEITIEGSNVFPVNLTGANVKIGKKSGNSVTPAAGISIASGNVTASGAKTSFTISVDASNLTEADTLTLCISVHGFLSNEFQLNISEKTLIESVTVVKAENHGEVKAGTAGTLNYMITVVGLSEAFSITAADITFILDDGGALPAGITANVTAITASNTPTQLSFSVDIAAGLPDTFNIFTKVKGRDSADSFELEVKPDVLTGTVSIKSEKTGETEVLSVDTSKLDGVRQIYYQWQRGENNANYTNIEGAVNPSYTITSADYGKFIQIRVSRDGFTNDSFIISNNSIHIEDPNVTPDLSVAGQLETLFAMDPLPSTYTITVHADELIEPQFLYGDIEITLKGASSTNNTLTLTEEGAMFTVNEGVTLILEDVVLIGINNNMYPLIDIWPEGTLFMNNGAVIKNNTNLNELKYYSGGGVYNFMGTFTMNGGTITGNTSKFGGGVFNDDGYFTMNGGEITNNTAESEGGGVFNEGYFEMTGGTISGNTAAYGGGVSNNSEFSMVDGTISGNTSEEEGGGVFNGVFIPYDKYGNFVMNDGTISGNKSKYGGGVSNWYDFYMFYGTISGNTSELEGGGVHNEGYFFMFDGTISGNKSYYGGGVTNWSVFAMLDGEISANEATDGGGGVDNFDYYDEGCIFYMQGGIIHGSNAAANLRNKSTGGFDSLSNYNTDAYHGIFTPSFESKGTLPSTNLTVEVRDGELMGLLAATSMTVTGIDAKYHGKTAVLAELVDFGPWGAFWLAFSEAAVVSSSTNFKYLTPVSPQLAALRLYILDIPIDDYDIDDFDWDNYFDDQLIIYAGEINLQLGNTPVAISAFIEVADTSITITDLPENLSASWDLVLFDRNVDGYGNGSGLYWGNYAGYIASFVLEMLDGGTTARCPDILEIEGEYDLSMQFRHLSGTIMEEYFFTIDIISGIENIVSFNDMVKQTLTPRVTPPSMKRPPRTERTMSSARSSVSFNDVRQTTTAAPAREMKQKQKASVSSTRGIKQRQAPINLQRPYPNLIRIQEMMNGVRDNIRNYQIIHKYRR